MNWQKTLPFTFIFWSVFQPALKTLKWYISKAQHKERPTQIKAKQQQQCQLLKVLRWREIKRLAEWSKWINRVGHLPQLYAAATLTEGHHDKAKSKRSQQTSGALRCKWVSEYTLYRATLRLHSWQIEFVLVDNEKCFLWLSRTDCTFERRGARMLKCYYRTEDHISHSCW